MAALSRRTLLLAMMYQTQTCRKRMWVRKIFEERKTKGEFHQRLHDHEYFFHHLPDMKLCCN